MIWGSVLHRGAQTIPDLYLTAANAQVERSKQYGVEFSTEFSLPKVFWGDLASVLQLVIAAQSTQFRAKDGHYVADQLKPFVDRVRMLLKASGSHPEWDLDALGSTQVILANALEILGEQAGENAPIEEAVTTYQAALKEYSRERVPLKWAMVQNNLGLALTRLGERQHDTARLEEAVAAYRAALKEYTRDRAPLDWAWTNNNLGIALIELGRRASDTADLEEAVAAFRAALKEYTHNRAPLDWAMTQNNVGVALTRLGEREIGTAHVELKGPDTLFRNKIDSIFNY